MSNIQVQVKSNFILIGGSTVVLIQSDAKGGATVDVPVQYETFLRPINLAETALCNNGPPGVNPMCVPTFCNVEHNPLAY